MMFLACAITQRYSTPTNNRLRTSSNTRNQTVLQADRVDIQSRNVGNGGIYVRMATDNQGDSARNGNVIMLETVQSQGFEIRKELEYLSVTICTMARLYQPESDSENGPNYDSEFIDEVYNPSTSFMNPLYLQSGHDQTYHEQPEIIKPTIGNDQINSDIIFDDPIIEVNDEKVEHYKNAHDQTDIAMELLARNAYKEAEKQQIIAKEVKQRNFVLTNELEKYKEKKFSKDVQVMMNVFESMEGELDDTLKQNKLLNDRLLEATLTHDVEKCVLMHSESKNDNLSVEI
ncbi:hypothetical protein Tco_1223632 [Tanacetum coccineum]